MSWNNQGYDPKIAESIRKNTSNETRTEIENFCHEILREIGPLVGPEEIRQTPVTKISLDFDLVAERGRKINFEEVKTLKNIMAAEQERANCFLAVEEEFHALRCRLEGDSKALEKDQIMMRCAIRAKAKE